MKKATQININDRLYHIDEDAYNLLNTYLDELSRTFTGTEGREIVSDIEARIGELFDGQTGAGVNVINIDFVNSVIDTIGRPDQIDDSDASASAGDVQSDGPQVAPAETARKKLFRDPNDKVFGGVLGGLSEYLGWDVTIMRLLVVVLCLCTSVIPILLVYMIAWMVIPVADTPRRQLEMRGEPVTVESVGNNVRSRGGSDETKSGLAKVVKVCAKIFIAFIGLMALAVLIPIIIAMVVLIAMLIGFAVSGVAGMATLLNVTFAPVPVATAIWFILLALVVLIPCVVVIWVAGSVLFGWRGAKTRTFVIGGLLWLLSLAGFFGMIFYLGGHSVFDHNPLIESAFDDRFEDLDDWNYWDSYHYMQAVVENPADSVDSIIPADTVAAEAVTELVVVK